MTTLLRVPEGRVRAIDLARGWALLGVALVNGLTFSTGARSGNFNWSGAHAWWDQAAELVVNTFFAHRAFPLLAFLFGLGVAKTWQQDTGSARVRLFALAGVGFGLGLAFWPGEIIVAYATIAYVLISLGVLHREDRQKTIRRILIVLTFFFTLFLGLGVALTAPTPNCVDETFQRTPSIAAWATQLSARLRLWTELGPMHMLAPHLWLMVLLGMTCARAQAFWSFIAAPTFSHPWLMRSLLVLTVSSVGEIVMGIRGGWNIDSCQTPVPYGVYTFFESLTMFASIAPALGLWAWIASRNFSAKGLSLIEAAGKNSLTMFIGMSIIFCMVFWLPEPRINVFGRFAISAIALATYGVLSWLLLKTVVTGNREGPAERGVRAIVKAFR